MRHREKPAWPAAASAFRQRPHSIAGPSLTLLLRVSAGLLFLLNSKAGAEDGPNQLLLHVRENIADTIKRLPKYVCTLTVDRTRYEPSNPEFGTEPKRGARSCDQGVADARRGTWKRYPSSSDRLRLDVAVNRESGRQDEMYSWSGEEHFSDRDLFELVPEGAISSGSFTSMLASIFGNDAARFSYNGDGTVKGKLLAEFGFRIPQERSQYLYVFGDPKRQIPMAYDGTLLVDPGNSDLVHLNLRTGQLPPDTGACEVSQSLDYSRVRLNDAEFLLPADARVVAVHTDGTLAENHLQYSACREFRSQVSVRYDGDRPGEGRALEFEAPSAPAWSLPKGSPFKVVFIDPIDTKVAAAGDLIRGRLKTAIRDSSERVLVPEGAVVNGRITNITHFFELARVFMSNAKQRGWGSPSFVVHIRLETVEVAGTPQPLKAVFDSGLRRFAKMTGPFSMRVDIGSADDLHSKTKETDTARFEFWERDPKMVVKPGLESSWVTVAP